MGSRTPFGVEPVTRRTVTRAGEMSPRSNVKVPRMPSVTWSERSDRRTDARVPSERAIACRTTSAAAAAFIA